MLVSIDTKCCARCKARRAYDSFNKSRRNKDGFQNYCRYCFYEYRRDRACMLSQKPEEILKRELLASCHAVEAMNNPKSVRSARKRVSVEEQNRERIEYQRWYDRTLRARLIASRGYYRRKLAVTDDPKRVETLKRMLVTCEELLTHAPLPEREI